VVGVVSWGVVERMEDIRTTAARSSHFALLRVS
jgi:hypothetical protein